VTETTEYDYNEAGMLSRVTQADGGYLDYTYDNAQRLTQVTDNLGNKVQYTLDAMGNRTIEYVRNPSNVLAGRVLRTIDALNRLQKIEGIVP